MKKKFFLAIGIVLLVTISLLTVTACSGGNESGGGNGGEDNTNAPQTATDGVLAYSLLPDRSGYSVTKLLDEGYSGAVNVPAKISDLPVKEVAKNAFCQTKITSITFSENLTTIGAYAFYACFDLETVNFPASLEEFAGTYETIDGYKDTKLYFMTFASCRSLTTVTFAPNCKLKEIPTRAFACSWLSSIKIPAAVEKIGDNAFTCIRAFPKPHIDSECPVFDGAEGFDGTFSVTFESGSRCRTVEDGAFSSTPLRSFTMPASVTELGDGIFNDCPYLQK